MAFVCSASQVASSGVRSAAAASESPFFLINNYKKLEGTASNSLINTSSSSSSSTGQSSALVSLASNTLNSLFCNIGSSFKDRNVPVCGQDDATSLAENNLNLAVYENDPTNTFMSLLKPSNIDEKILTNNNNNNSNSYMQNSNESCVVKKICKKLINSSTSQSSNKETTAPPLVKVFNLDLSNCISIPRLINTIDSSIFIDSNEVRNRLNDFKKMSKSLIIILDCRTYKDYNLKRIKNSIHINCRDKLSKKRLISGKITILPDLVNPSELFSNINMIKFDLNNNNNESIGNNSSNSNNNISTSCFLKTSDLNNTQSKCNNSTSFDDYLVIIYDDTTSDVNDLQSDSNPLRIVQNNIKETGFKKDCKILKGGFKDFSENCPEYVEEVLKLNANNANSKYYENQADQQQGAIENALMTKIEPYLYLGNELDAKNIHKLNKEGIHYILNVTKNIPFYDEQIDDELKSKFVFKRISVNDSCDQNLKRHFDESFQFIDEAIRNNSKVLVHCQAGVSRSPTIVIAYLMRKNGMKMNDVYNRIKDMRPIIAPNLIFMSQLMDYEAELFADSNKTGVKPLINISNSCSSFSFSKTLKSFCPLASASCKRADELKISSTSSELKNDQLDETNNSTTNTFLKMSFD